MSKLKVYNEKGAASGELEVAETLLVLDKGGQAVHEAVLAHLAAKRAGTASTLRKGEVAGSNKKPWRQKGTGRARAGVKQSPVWRGGGVAFGPHPRDYTMHVNRKVAQLAFRRAFSDKLSAGEVCVIEDLVVPEPKTRALDTLLKAMKLKGPVLIVAPLLSRNLLLAARNLPGVELARAAEVSTYELVRYPTVLATRQAMDVLTRRLGGGKATGVSA